jgi:hypothetical protein
VRPAPAGEFRAVHGLRPCACGCSRMVKITKNRNGIEKKFFSDKCRTAVDARARHIGRAVVARGIRAEDLIIGDRRRQEFVDLDRMTRQERLGALCRAAERAGVLGY